MSEQTPLGGDNEINARGALTSWRLGSDPASEWGELVVDFGAFEARVPISSRQAREFAVDVLADQGPHLGYQPPNERMRERPTMGAFGSSGPGGPRWKKRQQVDYCEDRLAEVREQFGDEAFGWALGRLQERRG